MPNIFEAALDKIAEGALDSQCKNMALGFVKEGVLAPADVPALAKGLQLLVQVLVATVAKGQG